MEAVQILSYVAVAVAIIAMLVKAVRYATAPEAMRWELYPVPHERGKSEYGGSYLEELDWWSKPRKADVVNELKEMAQEVLFLKGVFHHNKRVWVSSLPFHFGLYLCIGWLGLLLIGAIVQSFDVAVAADAGGMGAAIHWLTVVSGYAGLVLSGAGALGLLSWRLFDARQRLFNAPAEYFNLVFFVAVSTVTIAAQAVLDPGFVQLRGFVQSLVTLTPFVSPGGVFTLELVLIALLIMYIPVTRMSHFVAKYFLYHAVRWNDTPNERGSKIEQRLVEQLNMKVGWKGPHIQTGESWGEVVTKEPKHE